MTRIPARLRLALAVCVGVSVGAAFPALAAAADVSLDKAGPASSLFGAPVTYTLTVKNTAAEAATNVVVTDFLPATVTFMHANASQGTCARSGSIVTCNLGTISPSGTATVTITGLLKGAPGIRVTNFASVKASNDTMTPGNDEDLVTTDVVAPPLPLSDFSVTKTDAPDPVVAGELLTYTITVAGFTGPVTVADNLPAGVTLVDATSLQGSCTAPGPTSTFTVLCTVTPVATAAGSFATITVSVRPTTAGTITNEVTIGYAGGDPDPANNTVTAATVVTAATAVTMRSISATSSRAGNLVRWSTASEVDTLGFHVYREVNGKRVRANARMIAAKGSGSYSFLDRKAPKGKTVRYWVQEVAADGSRSWYGPARVARS